MARSHGDHVTESGPLSQVYILWKNVSSYMLRVLNEIPQRKKLKYSLDRFHFQHKRMTHPSHFKNELNPMDV